MTSTGRLRLRFKDDDGTGKLLVCARSGGFAGKGGAWFTCEKIKDFADPVGRFPISINDVPILKGGFWEKDNIGELAQEHLVISVSPADNRGASGGSSSDCNGALGGECAGVAAGGKAGDHHSYEPMVHFSRELKAFVAEDPNEVVFEGELLP
jgi:hypothetical protein